LFELDKKRKIIFDIQTSSDFKTLRQTYYQMIGMVHYLCNKSLKDILDNSSIINNIYDCLDQHPLNPEDGIEEYRKLSLREPNLKDIEQKDFLKLSYEEYDKEQKILEQKILEQRLRTISNGNGKLWLNVSHCGYGILETMKEYTTIKGQEDIENITNLRFAIRVLNKTKQLVESPNNSQYQREYHRLMENNQDGKPSVVKKVLGAMLMFSGAIAAVASVGLLVGTGGFASPFASTGQPLQFI